MVYLPTKAAPTISLLQASQETLYIKVGEPSGFPIPEPSRPHPRVSSPLPASIFSPRCIHAYSGSIWHNGWHICRAFLARLHVGSTCEVTDAKGLSEAPQNFTYWRHAELRPRSILCWSLQYFFPLLLPRFVRPSLPIMRETFI